MGKIMEKINSIFEDQKVFFKKYCVTFILIAIVTLFAIFVGFEVDNVEEFYVTMFFMAILVFVSESFAEFKRYRWLFYLLSFILAIGTKELLIKNEIEEIHVMAIMGIYIVFGLSALYKIFKDTKLRFSEYMSRLFNNSVLYSIAAGVIQLGLLAIVGIFVALILGESNSEIFLKAEFFFLGFFVVPAGILCLLNVKQEVLKPIYVLISYIILPIVIVAEIVVYFYLFKVLILTDIPSNTVFPIIASLFVVAAPMWIIIDDFKEKNKYLEYNTRIIPYSFLPLICMQIYAIGIRVAEYGLTPDRYLGVALVLFEIITILLTLIKKQKYIDRMFYVLALFIIVIMCIPGINVVDASWGSQLNRLTSVYKEDADFNSLSLEDKDKVVGAYNYLRFNDTGDKHIPEYIDEDAIKQYYRQDYSDIREYQEYKTVVYSADDEGFSIEGFKKIIPVDQGKYFGKKKIEDIDLKFFEVMEDSTVNKRIVEKVREYVLNAINEEEIVETDIIVDESIMIKVTDVSINYQMSPVEISHIRFKAYVLVK